MPIVKNHDASIYYETHGEGPPLVLAHGAGGNTQIWWQQVPFFAARHRVVTFDHRCFGRSVCAPAAFDPTAFAEDLVAVLDAEGLERVALVCQSMGGWTGLRMALDHPDRLGCLVLCGTPGGIVTDQIMAAARRIADGAAQDGIRGNAALSKGFREREPEKSFLYDQIASRNSDFAPSMLAPLAKVRITPDALGAHSVPTLLISGEEDALFPTAAIREIAGLIPGALMHTIPDCGHSPYYEMPEVFNPMVEEFVSQHA